MNLSIAKTNLLSSLPAGGTTQYTLTVVNSGPGAANNTVLNDPAVTGLSCNAVSCTSAAGGASCPAGPSTTMAYLQGSSTLTFSLACGVTATGY